MGIQGLLSFLEKAARPVNISEFAGCTVAVDSYCWLHKGAFSCADKLARGEETDQYVFYCMKYVNMLLSHNIKPILVFDGRHLPAKAETEKKRRENRETNRKRAAELLRLERDVEARSLIRRCVDVTHEMALKLMHAARAVGVDTIVAPYEADSQLAYLNINRLAHLVITEDSDLMLFGCKLVIFKMDLNGNGVLVEQEKIPLAMKIHPNHFSLDKFRYMCILSGCDYLPSLPGIGLVKASRFIKRTADDNISRALTRLGAHLNMPSLVVTPDYREKFLQADAMFRHQPVFDPRSRKVVPLTPLPPGLDNPLPETFPPDISYQLALGNINPFTLKKVDDWDPDQPQKIKTSSWTSTVHTRKSIWAADYTTPKPLPPKADPRVVKRSSPSKKVVSKSVTTLTEKIAALPPRQELNIEEELEKLRAQYGKPPPTKRLCLNSETKEEKKSHSQGSAVVFDEDFIEAIPLSPLKKLQSEDMMMTVEDILEGSPVLEGRRRRNPFKAIRSSIGREESPLCGSALSRLSKLKKPIVERSPTIVQSRYFSSTPLQKEEHKKEIQINLNKEVDLNETLKDIINTPSPKKKTESKSPVEEDTTPKKNVFSLTKSPGELKTKTPVSKNSASNILGQSFLSMLDTMSKSSEKNTPSEKPLLKKHKHSNFKWSQPVLSEFSQKFKSPLNGRKNLLKEGVKDPEKDEETSKECSISLVDDEPDGSNLSQSSEKEQRLPTLMKSPRPSSLKGKVVTPGRNKKKKSAMTGSGPGQPSIFEMFAFQPKAKLKT